MFNIFKKKKIARKRKIKIELLDSNKKIVIEEPFGQVAGKGIVSINYYEDGRLITGAAHDLEDLKRLPYQVAEITLSYFANRFQDLYKE